MEYKYRLYENLLEIKDAVNKLKTEWINLKQTKNFNYSEYTEKKINELDLLVKKKLVVNKTLDEVLRVEKATTIINELYNKHFQGIVDLKYILFFCDRSEKIDNFIKYQNDLDDKDYGKFLINAYVNQDYISVPIDILNALFTSDRVDKTTLMDEDELIKFNNLPNEVTIFRAMTLDEFKSGNFRFSWTLNRDIAEDFLSRNTLLSGKKCVIHKMVIPKSEVIAYINARNEEEIIYFHNFKKDKSK